MDDLFEFVIEDFFRMIDISKSLKLMALVASHSRQAHSHKTIIKTP